MHTCSMLLPLHTPTIATPPSSGRFAKIGHLSCSRQRTVTRVALGAGLSWMGWRAQQPKHSAVASEPATAGQHSLGTVTWHRARQISRLFSNHSLPPVPPGSSILPIGTAHPLLFFFFPLRRPQHLGQCERASSTLRNKEISRGQCPTWLHGSHASPPIPSLLVGTKVASCMSVPLETWVPTSR